MEEADAPDIELWAAGDALALLRGSQAEAVGVLAGRPLVAVRLDREDSEALAAAVGDVPCVTVGVAGDRVAAPCAGFDILLHSDAEAPAPWVACPGGTAPMLAGLAAAVEAAPLASVTLVQLLRFSGGLPVRRALTAESMAYGLLQAGPEFARWKAAQPLRLHHEDADPPVLVRRRGGELVVTLNRPSVRNALDTGMRDALVEALRLAAVDSTIQAVQLLGAGAAFCSGGDLAEFGSGPDGATAHAIRSTRSPATGLATVADRVTAHVHGTCVGAGVELPAFARRVIAEAGTSFALPEVSMGLIPGAGGTVSLPRRIGRQRTAYLALTGRPISAETALQWGLVDELSPG